ncbi:hypothetical protein [Undibacterium sp. Tian12W]|uniref:hypothetical protein n=1 Tax=Undibacterium sp. Tian12W TaxID=3413054 RepID=UPI003BF38E4E
MPHTRNILLSVTLVLACISPVQVYADTLRLDTLPVQNCETSTSSQEHWQAGHPPGTSSTSGGMPCIIGMPDPENRFALIKLNGTVMRLIPRKDRGSPILSFDSEDGKLRARIKVTRKIDGLTTSSTEGILTVRYLGQVVTSKVHNVQGS